MATISFDQTRAYFQAAVLGLRALEAREPRARRFGPEADARWARYCGKLHDGDRLQVLLRDASAPWGIAFAAAHIFQLEGIASDEPFGPSWSTPSAAKANAYLQPNEPPSLAACAAHLGVTPQAVDLPVLRPTSQLLLAGGAAILAAADAFLGRDDLDWARQVTVVADAPAHRQLAGLASLFVGAVKPCAVLASAHFERPAQADVVISADAEPTCAACLGG